MTVGGYAADFLTLPDNNRALLAGGPIVAWNGTAWVRWENTEQAAAITLNAQGVGTVNSADMVNPLWRGVLLMVNISAISGTGPSLVVRIYNKDPVSAQYQTVLASAALAATGLTALRVYPGPAAVANVVANDVLARTWKCDATVAGTGPSVTGTITPIMLV